MCWLIRKKLIQYRWPHFKLCFPLLPITHYPLPITKIVKLSFLQIKYGRPGFYWHQLLNPNPRLEGIFVNPQKLLDILKFARVVSQKGPVRQRSKGPWLTISRIFSQKCSGPSPKLKKCVILKNEIEFRLQCLFRVLIGIFPFRLDRLLSENLTSTLIEFWR